MLQKIIDLHTHSKYSRACSPKLELPNISRFCAIKGIDIVSASDFTHPAWFKHLEENLAEESEGLYKQKGQTDPTRFILTTEIACIYKHKEKTRRIHLLIFAPNLAAVRKFNAELTGRGVNISADGRPIMGIHAKEIVRLCLNIDPRMMVVPAHAWTPWFAVFGSKSGYDSLEECFEELTEHIYAIETGLSSDPPMNHRLSKLDKITLISNSDAHSLDNLGREANVMSFDSEQAVTYDEIVRIIKTGDKEKFLYTIEFYPEEGMYHFDGHRDCDVVLEPTASKNMQDICPRCKKGLTVGVLHRVDDLADRKKEKIDLAKFIPHRYIVPLKEIISTVVDVGKQSKKVQAEYDKLTSELGNEFDILLNIDISKIINCATNKSIGLAIQNMRAGKVEVAPGFDGVYGQVNVFIGKKYLEPQQGFLF